ncbi:LVIVD repeat-containing protein [Larkinella bovis]|uniref:LVIVD repeat-containing protein n=1 Tax=Larkinella bovis TaxID=683041 RepID=A0ABW0I5G7_9BACT
MKNYLFLLLASLMALAGCSELGSKDSAAINPGGGSGTGGSMARFAVAGNYLYVVNQNSLQVYEVTQSADPTYRQKASLGFGVETIFPYNNHLFIGTQTGMYIMNLDNPASPRQAALYRHIFSCDPVVAQGHYAYVTLRNGTACNTGPNRLEVVDISNLSNPVRVNSIDMINPHGLGIDGNLLFVSEGDAGLKIFDATDPAKPKLVKMFDNIRSYDVIPNRSVLIVTGKDGIMQYRYDAAQPSKELVHLSTLPVE